MGSAKDRFDEAFSLFERLTPQPMATISLRGQKNGALLGANKKAGTKLGLLNKPPNVWLKIKR
jgi:hypothetical protein